MNDEAQVFGVGDPQTFKTAQLHCWALHNAGRFSEAEAGLSAIGARMARTPGTHAADRLHNRCKHSWTVGRQRRVSEAAAGYDAVLADRTRELDPDHADTFDARHSKGKMFVENAHGAEAYAVLRPLLADMPRVLSPHHPNTLETRTPATRAPDPPPRPTTGLLALGAPCGCRPENTVPITLTPAHPAVVRHAHRSFGEIMKLGLLTSRLSELSLEQLAASRVGGRIPGSPGGGGLADRRHAHPPRRPSRRRRLLRRRRRANPGTAGPARPHRHRGDLLRQQPARRRRPTRENPRAPAARHRRRGEHGGPLRRHLHRPGRHPVGGGQPANWPNGSCPPLVEYAANATCACSWRTARWRLAPRRLPRQPRLLARTVGLDVRPRLPPHL